MKLFGFEEGWLVTIVEAIYPANASPRLVLGARDVPTRRLVRDVFAHGPVVALFGLRVAIWFVWWSAVVRSPWRTFGRLSAPARERHLAGLAQSPVYAVREMTTLLKMLGGLAFGAMPAVQRAIGQDTPDDATPAWAGSGDGAEPPR